MTERIVESRPAYDRSDEGYGVHGVDLRFILKGKEGAVQFVIFTNWHLPHVHDRMVDRCGSDGFCSLKPMPADVGYHSPVPKYEGQTVSKDACEYLDGRPCYYDGSGLHAEKVFAILVAEGIEKMWEHLESYYKDLFGEKKDD